MSNFVDFDRDQAFLLPPDLRDWIPEDDLAYFVIEAVEHATHRDIGVRFVAANHHPDHDTIATFRRENFAAVPAELGVPEMYDFGFWNRKLSSFAQEREIPVLDFAPGFAAAIANERLYFENNIHVNERGHVLIAELIQEFLEANELLRGAP